MPRKSKPVQDKRNNDKTFVGIITIEQQADMRRAARRQFEIDNGMMSKSGSGYHDSNARRKNRKERRKAKVNAKHGGGENE